KMVGEKGKGRAADEMEAAPDDIELVDGYAQVRGVPDARVKLSELAAKANPLRGAVQPGTEPGLEATAYFGPPMQATAVGAHAMVLEVDPETYNLKIHKYVVVHDCGRVI